MSLIVPRTLLGAALAALLVVAAACSSDPDVAEVDGGDVLTEDEVVEILAVATVGDASLTAGDLGVIDKESARLVITDWSRNEIFYAELAARGFDIDQSFLDEARIELADMALSNPDMADLDSLEGEIAILGQALPTVVVAYLQDLGVEPQWPVQLCSSHILLETEEEALAAIDRLDQGEDFAALAMELSTGPSGPGGGDLGCVDPGSFVSEFVDGAAQVDPPGISAPTQSQFGWHVIEVRSFGSTPSDDSATIVQAFLLTDEFLELRTAAASREVTVDPRYGVWDPSSLSVVPG